MAQSPQTLSIGERRTVASWAADCAELVFPIFEEVMPEDLRVRAAIDQTRSFALGSLDVGDAIRARGGHAGAAARHAPTPAARAAAYAAEQAAAVAHMGAHALGAAGYAGKAAALHAGCEDDTIARAVARRLIVAMSPQVAQALATLPALGENNSGPLTLGRLSTRHIGATIRAIQAEIGTQ